MSFMLLMLSCVVGDISFDSTPSQGVLTALQSVMLKHLRMLSIYVDWVSRIVLLLQFRIIWSPRQCLISPRSVISNISDNLTFNVLIILELFERMMRSSTYTTMNRSSFLSLLL